MGFPRQEYWSGLLIEKHLENYREALNRIVSSSQRQYMTVIDPFTDTSVQSAYLTLKEEKVFCELQSGQTLKIRVINLSLDKFYRSVKEDPLCQKKALSIFM